MYYSYKTEPLTDFTKEENLKKFKEGLQLVESYLGKTYPLIIDGKPRETKNVYTSLNPADHNEVIGYIHQADIEDASDAMDAALDAFEMWKKVPAKVRADVLFKSAAIIRSGFKTSPRAQSKVLG